MENKQYLRLCLEIGGTNIVAAIAEVTKDQLTASEIVKIISERKIKNLNFEQASKEIKAFACPSTTNGVTSIGISMFGPIDLKKSSTTFGAVLKGTCEVKSTWVGKSIALELKEHLGVPLENIFVDTDVNTACMAEIFLGGHPLSDPYDDNVAYITVGTGVGVGLVINGKPIHGIMHPEGGHIR